ncbi:MAG: TonB-dependent receptor [Mediterranea massiliensis]|nr:TonB-dependent receptor [Mediterranea massiliensis]
MEKRKISSMPTGSRVLSILAICMAFFLNVPFLNAQNAITVKGVVNDAMGPVIGASVVEKGTTNGVITGIDGDFVLTVPSNATLTISYVGYKTVDVPVAGKTTISVTLQEDNEMLDEVVVVGFGTQKKVNLTGSVGVTTSKELESRPVSTATQALQGLVPGLNITTNTGELDKNMSINIRGNGTIGQGSSGSPLILIDGMEGDLNTVNPQDIENISVLKDAAAASIYGSRAPFGVILVTTKKGSAGKTTINYNNNFRFSSPIRMPEQMDSYTFANYYNYAAKNAKWGDQFSQATLQRMLDYQAAGNSNVGGLLTDGKVWGKPAGDPFTTGYANVDWYKEIYKESAFSQEHNLSMSGGNERVSYYASLGFLDQNGLLRHGEDTKQRFNITAKLNANLTSWLKFNYSMRYTRQDNSRPSRFGSGLYEKIGRQTWPNLPVYDENGYYHNGNADTPAMQLALGGVYGSQNDRIYHQGAFIIEPIKNWITHVEFNYSTNTTDTRSTSIPYYNHDVNGNEINTNGTSSLSQSFTKNNYANWNIYTNYSLTLDEVHNFKAMLGFQSEEQRQNAFNATGYGLQVEDLPELNLISNTQGNGNYRAPSVGGSRNEWASAGFFGRLNYDYQGRYMAEANLRYDGTSRFRRGSRWQWSPSFSLGWNIAQESFWKDFEKVCNQLKLRLSYGVLGNMNTTGWYPTYRNMSLGSANGSWLYNPSSPTRPNTANVGGLISTALTWEKVRSWNVGLDFGLFNNRLTGSFDYFIRYTDNMVGPAIELPAVLGVSVPATNNSDLKTKGWELTVAWQDRLDNGFRYSARLNLSDARTYIERYPDNPTNSLDKYLEGRETGEIWGYTTVGIAQTQAEMDAHLAAVGGQSALGNEWGAGDIMYKDLDNEPGINAGARTIDDHGDLSVIGNNTPRLHFGIDLNASWKGFDVRAFFQGVMKRDLWIGSPMFWGVTSSMWWSAGFKEHGDFWHDQPLGLPGHEIPANTDAYYPRPVFDTSRNQQVQTRYLQDASYIRLKNLQFGYTLPKQLVKKAGFENCRIFVSGENLWTGTSLNRTFDPETATGGYSSYGNSYPLTSTWSFGLSLTL